MNIRQKVIGCGLVSILASTLLGGIGYWGQSQLADRLGEARLTASALRNHLEADMMHDALRADVLSALTLSSKDAAASQEVRTDYQEHSAQFRKSMQENRQLNLPERIRQAIDQAQPALERYIVQAGVLVEAALKDSAQAQALLPEFKRHFSELEEKNAAISALIEQQVQAAEHHADQQVASAIWWLLGGIVAVGALMVLITMELLERVLKPLNQAVKVAGSIAQGNLRNTLKVERQDEAGVLLLALQSMQENLREMINNIRHEGERLGQAAESLSHASGTIVRSSAEESDSATSMAAAMEEMIRNISQVAAHAQDAYSLSYQSENLAGNGGQIILSVVDSMERIAEAVNESSNTMTTLGKASEEIQSIIQNITGIAEQTNLLALNAAIEAARAGEQGRGFAVVADEVRNLAVRTAHSTQEITGMIERIRRSTEQAVQSMQSGVECVSEGVELARHAGDAIGEIQGGAHRAAGVVGEISHTMDEQSKASTEVAQRVEGIAEMSRRSRETVQELSEAIGLLNSVLTTLQGSVRQFQL